MLEVFRYLQKYLAKAVNSVVVVVAVAAAAVAENDGEPTFAYDKSLRKKYRIEFKNLISNLPTE
jgi:hypothetical protein